MRKTSKKRGKDKLRLSYPWEEKFEFYSVNKIKSLIKKLQIDKKKNMQILVFIILPTNDGIKKNTIMQLLQWRDPS